MSNPNRQQKPSIQRTVQDMVGNSFDNEFKVVAFEVLRYNPASNTLDRETGDSPTLSVQIKNNSSDSNIKYIGKAPIGSATSAAVWQIQRLDTTSGELVKTWADGDASFNNVYDNRESLTYN